MTARPTPTRPDEDVSAGYAKQRYLPMMAMRTFGFEGQTDTNGDGLRSLLSVLAMIGRYDTTVSLRHILEHETGATIAYASQTRIRAYLQGLIAGIDTDARLAPLPDTDRRVLDDAITGLRDALDWAGWNEPVGRHIANAAYAIALAERILDDARTHPHAGQQPGIPDTGPTDPPSSKSKRIEWLDRARGIGIILVVFGHVERGLASSHIAQSPGWALVDYILYCFHMPLFLFISGLNVDGSLRHGRPAFLKSKLLLIAYPYVLWSVLQGLILYYAGSLANTPKGLDDLFRIGWEPMSQFWFLYALFCYMVMAAFVNAHAQLAIAVVSYLLIDILPVHNIVAPLMHFMLFYSLGRVMAAHRDAMRPRTDVALGALLILLFNAVLLFRQGGIGYDSTLALPSAIGGIVVLLWLAQRTRGWLLGFLGSMSMAIYLMHILAGAGARIIMHNILHIPPWAVLYVPICTSVGIGVPILGYFAARRLGILPLLGLAIGRRGRHWIG